MLNSATHADIDPLFVLSNRIEAGLWLAIAIGCGLAAVRLRGVSRRECIIAAIAFAAFGASDLVEATTGAWWRPLWLLAWKGVCVVMLLLLALRYLRRRRAG